MQRAEYTYTLEVWERAGHGWRASLLLRLCDRFIMGQRARKGGTPTINRKLKVVPLQYYTTPDREREREGAAFPFEMDQIEERAAAMPQGESKRRQTPMMQAAG